MHSKLKEIYLLLALLSLFCILAINRAAFPDLDHGDEFTDANVLNAGENFVKFGFSKLYFLPLYEPYSKPYLEKPVNLYTHYPPLSEIVNGFIRIIFQANSLYTFRIFSLFLSWLTILFWYLLIKKITNSNMISFLSALFFLTNPMFIFGMDSLHESAYSEFFRVFILFVFTLYIYSTRQKKILLAGLWVLILMLAFVTFEYYVYLVLFLLLFRVFFPWSKKALSKRTISILISAQLVSLLIHFIQNCLYFGGLAAAFNDFKNAAFTSVLNRPDTALSLNLSTWFQYVIFRNFSLVFPFYPSVLFLSIFFSYLLYRALLPETKGKIKILFSFGIISAICGISWYIVMPSHSLAHAFVNFLARHLLPVAAISFALFLYIIFSFTREHINNNIFVRVLASGMAFTIAISGIKNSQLPVTAENLRSAQDFFIFKQCLLKLKEVSKDDDDIGLNYYRYPFIRYYANRRCKTIFDKNALGQAQALPHYFIFFPYNNPAASELFQSLQEKYAPLWNCDSLRFSSAFFKLKNQ